MAYGEYFLPSRFRLRPWTDMSPVLASGPGSMPRPRYYAPPNMPGMPPMGGPYGQVPPQQFGGQYPPPPPGPPRGQPGGPGQLPGGRPGPPNGALAGRPAPAGLPMPPNVGRPGGPPVSGQPPRGPPGAQGARPGGYKGVREEPAQSAGLTAAMLANAAPAEQKQMLGEA